MPGALSYMPMAPGLNQSSTDPPGFCAAGGVMPEALSYVPMASGPSNGTYPPGMCAVGGVTSEALSSNQIDPNQPEPMTAVAMPHASHHISGPDPARSLSGVAQVSQGCAEVVMPGCAAAMMPSESHSGRLNHVDSACMRGRLAEPAHLLRQVPASCVAPQCATESEIQSRSIGTNALYLTNSSSVGNININHQLLSVGLEPYYPYGPTKDGSTSFYRRLSDSEIFRALPRHPGAFERRSDRVIGRFDDQQVKKYGLLGHKKLF